MFVVGVLVLGLCCFHQTSGVIHSWKAFYTASTGLSEFPEFVSVAFLDNEPWDYFDSKTNRYELKPNWISEDLGQDYQQNQENVLKGQAATFKNNVKIAMSRFNETQGIHIFQKMYGCEWDDETQHKSGLRLFGYDGEDFIVYDMETFRWIAPIQQAEATQRKWNNDQAGLGMYKNYITNECIDWLQKYLMYGKTTFQKQVAPEVSLMVKPDASAVACHATGFYPDGVVITWKRDGNEMQEDTDVGETLPNEDGTFQKRSVLTVKPEERKKSKYTCEVAHKSGELIVKTLVEDDNTLGIIIGCVIAALVVIGGIVGFVMMKKKKDYNKAEQSDTDSDNSNPNARK